MLKHIVIFKFKQASSQEAIEEIVASFLNLKNENTGILEIDWGENVSPENHHQGFTHCFTLTFQSLNELNKYQLHPKHLDFQEVLIPHMEKVFVVDYNVS